MDTDSLHIEKKHWDKIKEAVYVEELGKGKKIIVMQEYFMLSF